jgi:2-keto-3-deoxy-L-rhamnonate aldolase RhmA
MLTSGKNLKARLKTTTPVVGMMATDHAWPLLVEICQNAGLDYLIIDCEHGSFSDDLVAQVCQIGRLINFPVLVRTISCETSVIRRTLDLGPCGILLPNIRSTDELDQVQAAVQMPPRGTRRPGGMGNYWMKDFNYDSWMTSFEEHFIVIAQIESQAGVDAVDDIAAHPLVTALGLGPYDLSADLGCCWAPNSTQLQAAFATVKNSAEVVGKKVWAGPNAAALLAKGYTFLWIGTVSSALSQTLTNTIHAFKTGLSVDSAVNDRPPA